MTDDLDDLLAPRPAPADPAAKEALLRRTVGVLRRRRLVRRAAAVAAVGLVFAVGVAVGRFGRPDPAAPDPVLVPVPILLPAGGSPGEVPQLAAADLELEAEKTDDRAASAKLFRQAGDKYLAELTDIPAATRCYANFLNEAGPDGRAVVADDSWLLIRMKASRAGATVKEKNDDPNPGT